MDELRNEYRILIRKPEGLRPLIGGRGVDRRIVLICIVTLTLPP